MGDVIDVASRIVVKVAGENDVHPVLLAQGLDIILDNLVLNLASRIIPGNDGMACRPAGYMEHDELRHVERQLDGPSSMREGEPMPAAIGGVDGEPKLE